MIEGNKVYLGPVEKRHLDQMLQWRNDKRFRQYYREYRILNSENQMRWWCDKIMDDDSWQFFVIHPKDDVKKIIGTTGLTYIHPINMAAEMAITIGDSEYRGGGYGSDALRALINYGFYELNLNRIWCEVYSNNAAIDFYKHIGFKEEGVLRESYFCDGTYWNSHILSILRSEWNK